MMQRAAMLGGFWLLACGPRSEPQAPAQEPAVVHAERSGAPGVVEVAPPVPDAPATAPAPVSTTEPPKAPSIHEVCFEMCDKVKARCARSAFESCQVNCGKYESPTDGCESVVVAALACARDAADLVCANVAPESCAAPFRRIGACNSGQKTPESAPATSALPDGFAIYEIARERIAVPMPRGVTAGEGDVLATANHSEGAVYSIRKLPRPEGKLTEKVFLKLAMSLFGRCSDKMKMGGMVEKPGRTSINYTTKCPDGSEEAGLFWATDRALFLARAKGAPGRLGPTDAFVYGFEVK